VAVANIQLFTSPFEHIAVEITEADRFDEIEYCIAHCTCIHSQGAPNSSGNSFQELEARQVVAFGFD